jgi:hypothetical protein
VTAAPRYAVVAHEAGDAFAPATSDPGAYEVVERTGGGSGTDFGVPSVIADLDRRPVSADEAARLARFVEASWAVFDRVASGAPAELRKGPRGGGRDRDKMIGHVVGADWYYAREIGVRERNASRSRGRRGTPRRHAGFSGCLPTAASRPQVDARYAARRIAWHALDHAWEMEDRSEPA